MHILALGKDERIRRLKPLARKAHFSMRSAHSLGEVDLQLKRERPDLVLVDEGLPALSGQELLKRVQAQMGSIPVFIIDATHHDLERWVTAFASLDQPQPLPSHAVASLHNRKSGRLDARLVSDFFGWKLAGLARVVGRSSQAVHKTPDAESLQKRLIILARIAALLVEVFGSGEKGRIWLNSPHPDLDDARPIDLVKGRDAEAVAQLLEDALKGQPG